MSLRGRSTRRQLDARFARLRSLADEPRPHGGWVRSIREALGMSTVELARRMGVSQQRISVLERAEVDGAVKLESLQRAAEALGCDLVYALLPRTSLEDAVRAQARQNAAAHLGRVSPCGSRTPRSPCPTSSSMPRRRTHRPAWPVDGPPPDPMRDPLVPRGEGQTELSDEDRAGLRQSHISTRGELFDAEQQNIASGTLRRRAPNAGTLLDDVYLRRLHRAMFGEVWEWAGRYRLRETNIGVDPARIPSDVRNLVDDARAWVEHRTYEADELAVRFHHRLVAIHPFPNGIGRHGRLSSDYLVAALGTSPFSWGAGLEVGTEELRARYLAALRAADRGELEDLVAFARL